MRILFVSSEVVPFSKTGGLADVAGALPAALKKRGNEVTIITPRYRTVDPARFGLRRRRGRLGIQVRGKTIQGGLLEGETPDGVDVIFVDQAGYFDRDGLYGDGNKDYADNDERFTFFCRAALECCRLAGLTPDVIHCNDWQTGPIPALLQFEYRDRPELNSCGSVMTIHNLGYQGLFPPESMMSLGLGWQLFTPSNLEFFGKVSFLKAGLVFADKLTTVSRRYAKEIRTQAMGFGLQGLLNERAQDLRGIMNGVDYRLWDPQHDRLISANYSFDNLAGKVACKADLQQATGLPVDPDLPIFGCISRLTSQKGLDLFIDAADELLTLPCQWVFLGSGDPQIEAALEDLAGRYPEKLAERTTMDEELAHRIQAGADMLMMPSLYEPCGLNQLYALRYGTIPIVRAVGGLDDTIDDVAEGEGNGFKFSGTKPADLVMTVRRALEYFGDRVKWRRLQEYTMSQDFSWDLPARQYETVYRQAAELRTD
ncbi:MAG TPA: glycogen synthase GlgA [Myxococcota bacterium]|nr:glycogen synthase GlgA [Myxococcota bacterium]